MKYILKALTNVSTSYNNLVEIKFQNNCQKTVSELCKLFLIDDENYVNFNEKMFDEKFVFNE